MELKEIGERFCEKQPGKRDVRDFSWDQGREVFTFFTRSLLLSLL